MNFLIIAKGSCGEARSQLYVALDQEFISMQDFEWTYQHLMSVNGKFADITRDDLLKEADRFAIRRPVALLANVRSALKNWPEFASQGGLGKSSLDAVASDFQWL